MLAPSAIRRPISFDRWPTVYDMTPYTPAIARHTASAREQAEQDHPEARRGDAFGDRGCFQVVNVTGTSGSRSWIFRRTVSISADGSAEVRARRLKLLAARGCCVYGMRISACAGLSGPY